MFRLLTSSPLLLRTAAMTTALACLLAVGTPAHAATRRFPAGDEAYHTYAEMTSELHALAAAHPDIVQVSSAGESYWGRQIWLLKISDHVAQDETEPEVLVLGLTHGREHLTVEQALTLIHWLVDGYPSDAQIRSIVNSTEVWFMPMLNPDGGEFDIKNGRYHSWRKNRQPTPGSSATGTDINRNYSHHWGCCGGSSSNPYAITYRGPSPFSSPESRVERRFVRSRVVDGVQQIRLALSLHSYGEQILYPYGYTQEAVPSDMRAQDHKALVALANGMAARNGYRAIQGSSLYVSSGGQGDWIYGTQRVLTFTIELGPRTRELGGFYPSGDQIAPLTESNRVTLLWFLEQAPCPYDAAGLTSSCAAGAAGAAGAAAVIASGPARSAPSSVAGGPRPF